MLQGTPLGVPCFFTKGAFRPIQFRQVLLQFFFDKIDIFYSFRTQKAGFKNIADTLGWRQKQFMCLQTMAILQKDPN